MRPELNERDHAEQDVLTLLTHAFTLHMEGDPVGARLAAQMAAPAVPVSGPAQAALGRRLLSIDDPMGAEMALRTARDLGTVDADTLTQLARSLQEQGRFQEAAGTLRQVLQLDPANADACLNLGIIETARHNPTAGLAYLRRAVRFQPDHAGMRLLLGNAAHRAGALEEAESARRAACALDPANPAALTALAESLLDRAQVRRAQHLLVRASRLDPADPRLLSQCLHLRHLLPGQTPPLLKRVHQGWQKRFGTPMPERPRPRARQGGPLRVGILSQDLGQTHLGPLLRPLFRRCDPARLHLTAISDRPHDDALTAELRAHADAWLDVAGQGDAAVAHRLQSAQLDVLIDLTGHAPGNRLPMLARYRPAPLQVTWAGYPGTTGLRAIDLLIADGVLVPDAEDPHHVERVVRLASGAVTYEPSDDAATALPPRRAKADTVTLMSFARPEQVGDPCLDLWAPVLRALPSARLVLMGPRWGHPSVTTAVAEGFRKRGIDPRRLIMSEATHGDLTTHLLGRADVVLDSTPESVSLGTLQALAMGVPVVTLPGKSVAGRHAAAHLTHAKLPQGIARSPDDYVDRVERALRTPRFPVRMDCDAWVREFTLALETAFDEIVADSLPDDDANEGAAAADDFDYDDDALL